ncbi:MAG: 30S ribosomal protein S16 [Patescibacteria group bacterium]
MLIIRFNRTGKKNRVSYRLVLQEKTKAPGKRHIEILGSHDPHTKTTILKKDRILEWLKQGVQTSDVVHNLLLREGVIEGTRIPRKMPRPVVKEEPAAEAEPVEAKAEEEPVAEAEPVEVEAEGAEPVEAKVAEETPAVEEVATEEVEEAPVVEEVVEPSESVEVAPEVVEAEGAEPVEAKTE